MSELITIRELKEFLAKLPEEFDSYGIVNGEFGNFKDVPETSDDEESTEGMYYRIDKPILTMLVDEESKELVFLHQSEEDVDQISYKEVE